MTMKKELIQTRNRKMNKKMIVKHEELEEDWTNNEDWLKSYTLTRWLNPDGDMYIMMQCVFVTKNEHFLLGVSCNHLNPP